MTRDEQIQRDLGVKLSTAIEQLMQRDLAIAERMLPVTNLAEMLLNTAAGVNASIVSCVLQMRQRDGDVSKQFDVFAGARARAIFEYKPKILDGLALIEAGKPDEAIAKYGAGRAR